MKRFLKAWAFGFLVFGVGFIYGTGNIWPWLWPEDYRLQQVFITFIGAGVYTLIMHMIENS